MSIDSTACDSIQWDGNWLASTGTYYDTLQNVAGCDSIVTLNLTINQSTFGTDVLTACDTLTWIDGITYTASNNTATHTLTNSNGCDSVVTMDLTVNYSIQTTEILVACDSMTWNNNFTYTQSGIYYDSLQTINGCDSILVLELTINSSPVFSFAQDTIGACGGDSVLLDAGSGFNSYLWSNGATSQTIYAGATGNYSVTVGNGIVNSGGSSLSFDGVDDRVVVTSNNLPTGNSTRSVSAWFYPESDYGNIFSFGDGTLSDRRFSAKMTNGTVGFIGENNDHFGYNVTLNQWHFITITYANNNLKMYVDGVISDSTFLGVDLNTDSSYPLVIGSNTTTRNDEYFNGKVAQVSLWDRELNATDIQNHMSCPPSTNALGLIGYWELGNNANDATAYGNNGAIEGAIVSTEAPVFTCNNQDICSTTDSVYVDILNVDIVQNDTTICEGDSLVLVAYNYENTQNRNLSIGDTYQGGIVFYLDGNGGGLVAAPIDQSNGSIWGCFGLEIAGADGIIIGTGYQNTIDIEAGCNTSGTAADICANLSLGGYNDWFLPSFDELFLMYENIGQGNSFGLGNIGNFDNYYYSSSENQSDTNFALGLSFDFGTTLNNPKAAQAYVRAVRSFTSSSTSPYSYAWSPGGETTPTINPTPTVTTTHYVAVNNGINSCQDSVTIYVLPTSTLAIDTAVCDSMFFAGNNITTSGLYYDTLPNAVGCDSIVTLNLTIYNSSATIDSTTSCDSAVWNGNVYTTSGIYVDTLTNYQLDVIV